MSLLWSGMSCCVSRKRTERSFVVSSTREAGYISHHTGYAKSSATKESKRQERFLISTASKPDFPPPLPTYSMIIGGFFPA
jgi:hypothetical protein